ncbi:MAG: hypothetical protein V3V30_04090 [Parvularculaceae bacterium]
MTFDISLFAGIGFLFAAYAVIGNDALQTLGTFINSNRRLHWFWLFLFAALILVVTFSYGWVINDGDPSWGRLAKTSKYPVVDIQWYHALPPLVLVIITRFGVPVSTSFMVLTVFATFSGLTSMLEKSLFGYFLAFAVGGIIYAVLSRNLERYFRKTADKQHGAIWVVLQWFSTGYLWAVWLIQDFANIFVFLPRQLSPLESFSGLAVIIALLAITFANSGGPVQKILQTKTSVTDIRSATIIDFIYASLLFYFKELNNLPMSTTFVFLGLIAGREYAFALTSKAISVAKTTLSTVSDLSKAFIGLVMSIDMAVGLPCLAQWLTTGALDTAAILPSSGAAIFFFGMNLMLIPVGLFLAKKQRPMMYFVGGTLSLGIVIVSVRVVSEMLGGG